MRTLLFLLLVSWVNLSLAEMIGGHNLGGKFTRINEAKKLDDVESFLPNVYSMKADTFFDEVQIETDENNVIRSIGFVKNYSYSASSIEAKRGEIKEDFKRVLGYLEKKYGRFEKKDASRILGFHADTNSFYMNPIKEGAIIRLKKKKMTIVLVLSSEMSLHDNTKDKYQPALFLMYFDDFAKAAGEAADDAKYDLSDF